jgi:hypothetical protein
VIHGLNDPRSRRAFRDGAVDNVVAKRRSKSATYLVRELHRALRRSGLFPHQNLGHVTVSDHGGASDLWGSQYTFDQSIYRKGITPFVHIPFACLSGTRQANQRTGKFVLD